GAAVILGALGDEAVELGTGDDEEAQEILEPRVSGEVLADGRDLPEGGKARSRSHERPVRAHHDPLPAAHEEGDMLEGAPDGVQRGGELALVDVVDLHPLL